MKPTTEQAVSNNELAEGIGIVWQGAPRGQKSAAVKYFCDILLALAGRPPLSEPAPKPSPRCEALREPGVPWHMQSHKDWPPHTVPDKRKTP